MSKNCHQKSKTLNDIFEGQKTFQFTFNNLKYGIPYVNIK